MKIVGVYPLLVAAALSGGCAAGADSTAGGGYGGYGSGVYGSGGSSGSGKADAGIPAIGDVGAPRDAAFASDAASSNLATDAPTFNWDTHQCTGCAGNGAGGASAPGGSGGSGGSKGSGGASTGAGGSSGRGGSSGVSLDAASTADAMTPGVGGSAATGTGGGRGGTTGGGGGGGAGLADAGITRDAGVSDLPTAPSDASPDSPRPIDGGAGVPDAKSPDTTPVVGCSAQITAVIPVLGRLDRMVAGASSRVVLRAEVVSGTMPAATPWSWSATWEGAKLSVAAVGTQDPNAAMFAIGNAGSYTFRATAGSCSATAVGYAVAANVCSSCDKSVIIRAAPPASSDVPVQSGALTLLGSSPFGQMNVVLAKGVSVLMKPSIGTSLVKSYVRVNDAYGGLVVDGLADLQASGFATRLLAFDPQSRTALRYDVLVVPLDGPDGTTIAATAPQLYISRDPTSLNGLLPLSGGATVTGTTLSASGQPVADVRVMLTNQDPAAAAGQTPPKLLFSSVGRSDAQGNYTLHVQKGSYWVTFSPPPNSGLSDALGPNAVDLTAGNGNVSFQWSNATSAPLTLQVVDAAGAAAPGVAVRVTSSQAKSIGTLTVTPAGGASSTGPASGNVQVEDTTDASGTATFPALPANQDYIVLLKPSAPGPLAATTTTAVTLLPGGTSKTVALLPQSSILGQLVGRTSLPIDYTTVTVVAYDVSTDSPEAPRTVSVNADGSFAFGATPAHPYVLVAEPDGQSGYARTFVGPGALQTSEFTITQNLLLSMPWRAAVTDESLAVVGNTTLQIFCDESWPNCVNSTVPLAETTADASGAFELALPDPSSR
jgi:hypothetical protein